MTVVNGIGTGLEENQTSILYENFLVIKMVCKT
jgi:hypothetical protein